MYECQENIFYYLTVYNENYVMPAMPDDGAALDGVLRGAYCWRRSKAQGEDIHLLGSGSIMQQALVAGDELEKLGYAAHVWSVTSYTELAREAEACERHNRLWPLAETRVPYIQQLFAGEKGPVVAVTDYMKALPSSIACWMPESYTVLGTDGFGLSESRRDLRDHFEIGWRHIVQAALVALYRRGALSAAVLQKVSLKLGIDVVKPEPVSR